MAKKIWPSKTWVKRPHRKSWRPGTIQIGIFIRHTDGSTIEWLALRGTPKQLDAVRQVIASKVEPDDYGGPEYWFDTKLSGSIEILHLLGNWRETENQGKIKDVEDSLVKFQSEAYLVVDVRLAGAFDTWGFQQVFNFLHRYQGRVAWVCLAERVEEFQPLRDALEQDLEMEVPEYSDMNVALDTIQQAIFPAR